MTQNRTYAARWAALMALGISLLGATANAGNPPLPKHRGPLTPREMNAITTKLHATTVRRLLSDAKHYLAAVKTGGPYRGRSSTLFDDGSDVILINGQKIKAGVVLSDERFEKLTYAMISPNGEVTVRVNLARQESGKPGKTRLAILFKPAGTTHQTMQRLITSLTPITTLPIIITPNEPVIYEYRPFPNGGTTVRYYDGSVWDKTTSQKGHNGNRGEVRYSRGGMASTDKFGHLKIIQGNSIAINKFGDWKVITVPEPVKGSQ